MRAEGGAPEENRLLSRYLKPQLLIIDDMGLKELPARSGKILLDIILRRHESRSTLMTSNRPVEDWGKLLGDVPTAGAILDRLLSRAEIIEMTGRSHRLAHRGTDGKAAKADAKGRARLPERRVNPPCSGSRHAFRIERNAARLPVPPLKAPGKPGIPACPAAPGSVACTASAGVHFEVTGDNF